jgi:ABC-type multidrug transport system fused ATPase/permease subunit
MQGTMSLGGLLAAQALLIALMVPVGEIAELLRQMQVVRADLARIDDVAQHPEDPAACAPGAKRADSGTREAAARPEGSASDGDGMQTGDTLALDDVTVGYGRSHAPLLSGIDCTAAPGERVAIVGATGSGKSTVLRVAAGLLEPWSGRAMIGGSDVRVIDPATRARRVAIVSQRISIFSATLRENLSLWDDSVPESDMRAALADVQLAHLAEEGDGLGRQLLSGGANLSGGEAQRIEIARALCRNPRVLLMDEATSALDPVTERAILAAIACRRITCLMVAHRLSALRHCDRVMLLEGARIAAQGTHESLRAECASYRALVGGVT